MKKIQFLLIFFLFFSLSGKPIKDLKLTANELVQAELTLSVIRASNINPILNNLTIDQFKNDAFAKNLAIQIYNDLCQTAEYTAFVKNPHNLSYGVNLKEKFRMLSQKYKNAGSDLTNDEKGLVGINLSIYFEILLTRDGISGFIF